MAKVRGHVTIDIETCKGCELCIYECPQHSLEMSSRINFKGYHYAVLVVDNCTGCTNCALVCPEAVITVYREQRKPRERRGRATVLAGVKEKVIYSPDPVADG